jgi:hypothetical protein
MVLIGSSAIRGFLIMLLPSAIEANIIALWVMDLSGGGVISPLRVLAFLSFI